MLKPFSSQSLHEKCPNTEFFTGKYGPEKTPYLESFHAVNGSQGNVDQKR